MVGFSTLDRNFLRVSRRHLRVRGDRLHARAVPASRRDASRALPRRGEPPTVAPDSAFALRSGHPGRIRIASAPLAGTTPGRSTRFAHRLMCAVRFLMVPATSPRRCHSATSALTCLRLSPVTWPLKPSSCGVSAARTSTSERSRRVACTPSPPARLWSWSRSRFRARTARRPRSSRCPGARSPACQSSSPASEGAPCGS